MNWASYGRVSSDGQTGLDKYGLERQDRDNERYIRRHGFTGDITTFRDVISGTREDRTAFEALLKAARAGEVKRVCIPEPDRLAREVFSGVALIFELWAAGLEVHNSQRGLIDRSSGESRRQFFGDMIDADKELEKIVRRMYAGKLDKVRSGKTAHPLDSYGWDKGQPVESERETIRWAAREVLTRGLNAVCADLNARGVPTPRNGVRWTHSQLKTVLTNPVLIGRYAYGRRAERLEVAVPAILTEDEFYAMQRAFERRRKMQGRASTTDKYQLGGHIRCGECQHAMTGWTANRGANTYYQCANARGVLRRCSHKALYRCDNMHAAVWDALRAGLRDIATLTPRAAPVVSPTINRKALETRLARAKAAYEAGVDTLEEYADRKRLISAELARADLETRPAPPPDPKRLRAMLTDALNLDTLHEVARGVALIVTVRDGGTVDLEIGA